MIPRYDVLTLHPEMVRVPLGASIVGRAVEAGTVDVRVHDLRDWAEGKHKQADDSPFGGGPGMVMKVDVVARAVATLADAHTRVLLTSPGGRPLTQADARRWAELPRLLIVCGHYEGIDARIEGVVHEEVSLGDFVLTGGEIAAMAIVDATARLVPGVLGNAASTADESFGAGLLEYPQYTRPREWNGLAVPEVLLSGNHARIEAWRREMALARTKARRPDLYAAWATRGVDGEPDDR